MNGYHTVIIGGGHNGLIAARILAMHGLRVLVVEQNTFPGGLAGGVPGGAPPSIFAYAIGLLPGELARLVGLDAGKLLHKPDPSWVEYSRGEGPLIRWWRSPERLAAEAREAGLDGLPVLLEKAREFWRCYKEAGLYYTPEPPSADEALQMLDNCPEGAAEFLEEKSSRILAEHLPPERWDLVLYPSMYEALGFALAYYLQNSGVWDLPVGGMGVFAAELRRLAAAAGVEFLEGCRAEALVFQGRRAVGVRACGGRRIMAEAILFAGPIQGLLRLEGVPERLEEWEVRRLHEASRRISRVERVDVFLRSPPRPPREESWRGYPIIVSWDERGGGDYSYPTLYGPALPGGLHLVQASGYPGSPEERLPPGVEEDQVVAWWRRGPEAQEYCCGNPTGYPDHLPMREPYIMDTRPLPGWGPYRTSIEGLYHGSASSYPGGEVNGVAGHNAAVRILLDLGLEPRHTLARNPRTRRSS